MYFVYSNVNWLLKLTVLLPKHLRNTASMLLSFPIITTTAGLSLSHWICTFKSNEEITGVLTAPWLHIELPCEEKHWTEWTINWLLPGCVPIIFNFSWRVHSLTTSHESKSIAFKKKCIYQRALFFIKARLHNALISSYPSNKPICQIMR